MISNTFKLTGMAAAIALVAGTLGAPAAYAQLYDAGTIQTTDLGKSAAYTDRKQPVAPIAARPNGNAYIQWATQQDWNGGSRGKAFSKVYVTEVEANGSVVGNDIECQRCSETTLNLAVRKWCIFFQIQLRTLLCYFSYSDKVMYS